MTSLAASLPAINHRQNVLLGFWTLLFIYFKCIKLISFEVKWKK